MNLNGIKTRKPGTTKRGRARILVWGGSNEGKTYGLCGFPNSLYIDPENGASEPQYQKQLAAGNCEYIGVEEGALDHNGIITAVEALGKAKHSLCNIVVDSLSKLFDSQVASDYERMAAKGRDMEKTFGAEKKGAIGFVRRLIRWADMLDMNLILVCHSKDKWEDNKVTGAVFDGWAKLEYEFHLGLRIVNRRAVVTKTRYDEFPKGESFAWNYSEFADRYGRDPIESKSVPVPLATSGQVVELNGLTRLLKLDPAIVEKWLDKAQAESFAEFSSEQIAKAIEWCKSEISKASTDAGKAA